MSSDDSRGKDLVANGLLPNPCGLILDTVTLCSREATRREAKLFVRPALPAPSKERRS
jgi:hypothetical protein